MVFQLDKRIVFPPPELANDDGLLALGGDLSEARLSLAYSLGIFPWYSEETPILWYSPHERFVIFPRKVKVSKTMRKTLNSGLFRITENLAFEKVIRACAEIPRADQEGTWITAAMQKAYVGLHKAGIAHSVEVWQGNDLVGGLYGVQTGAIFSGESMFSRVSNASKAALIWLCKNKDYKLIDCQFHTEHLESMGAEYISREAYMKFLKPSSKFP